MMRFATPALIVLWTLVIGTALAVSGTLGYAQNSDPMRLIPVLENQRNIALTLHAQAEARAAELSDEVAKLKARLKELEAKVSEKPADK